MATTYSRSVDEADRDLSFTLKRSIELVKERKEAMKHQVEVTSREEGKAVEKALANPVTKAIVVVEGVLSDLKPEQQKRVLKFVEESLNGTASE